MYDAADSIDASPRSQALALEVTSLIRERRAGDPDLGFPEALIALELAKRSLLRESGFEATSRRIAVFVVAALSVVIAGLAFFLLSQ